MRVLADVWLDEWDAQMWSNDREADALLGNWQVGTWLDECDEDVFLGDWKEFQKKLEVFLARCHQSHRETT